MNDQAQKIIKEIQSEVGKDNFLVHCEEKLDELALLDPDGEAIEKLLKVMEDNPDAEFGSPGPIVHYVERYFRKGYEEELLNSISRIPTLHTIWMLNRIINGTSGEEKDKYYNVMTSVIGSNKATETVKKAALDFTK